jgi:glycosyltransferase involved in cell wall biosynthesis
LRILYLADIRFPIERANGIQTAETCHALAARGHSIALFVRPDIVRPPRDPFRFYDLQSSARLEVKRARVYGAAGLRRAAYLTQALAVSASMVRRYDVLMTRDLGIASAVLRLPRAARPPVVYESHGFAPVFAETIQDLVSGATAATASKRRRLSNREQRVWRQAEGYVTTTEGLRQELEKQFGTRAALATIPNGTRLRAPRGFARAKVSGLPIVAYAGHLYKWKGVDVLLRALALLPHVRGVIVGGHPLERDLERVKHVARELNVNDRVTFTGAVESSRVAAYLENADVLVLPTVDTPSARYTSPLKLFEYMAAGRPIVASDLTPIREIVEDGVSAALVAPNDPDALAAGIRRLLDDRSTGERLARHAFERAASFTWDRRAERLERLFEQVVGQS